MKTDQTITPCYLSAGCKLLAAFNKHMSAVRHINSMILLAGGAKRSIFSRLSKTLDTLCYVAVWQKANDMSLMIEPLMMTWKEGKVESKPEQNSSQQLQCMQSYQFVGDNVDLRTRARHQTLTQRGKDEHMFQIVVYRNRVSGHHLTKDQNQGNIETLSFSDLLPSASDRDNLIDSLAFIVAKIWTEHLYVLHDAAMESRSNHKHSGETKVKTESVCIQRLYIL